ncbi:MAG: hypothetical protein M1812_004662 [Candelaria pacifica]|nr:MAG: hypothetical protein M1812_004662 [Candelaria pacifica]
MAPAAKRRKTSGPALEEIKFDFDARSDYLTGFHKRKLQRMKHAQEEAAKKERADRIEERKRMREERKADLEKHVETVNAMLRKADEEFIEPEDSETDDRPVDNEEWDGIDEPPKINHEDEYIDEGKYTSVTVEAIDISKDGFRKAQEDDGQDNDAASNEEDQEANRDTDKPPKTAPERDVNGKRVWTKEKPDKPKKKKKKFRYENKVERKATRFKERAGNKAKARARRD